ncbi:MAG TPA: hypothetical protein VKO18_14565 [Terriglobia bacterium]|nr:hypothetical protein [Terriglobia bacterium]
MTIDRNQITADMSFDSASDSKFTRQYREEVEMVFSGLDCALVDEKAVYCTSELTTGARLYAALREHQLKTKDELRKQMGKDWYNANLWEPNIKAAMEFAKSVRSALGGRTMVITPSPFTAPGWSQPEYLAFWETLLRTRIRSAWFNHNWQFSNSCTFEFAVAQHVGLSTLDHEGNALGLLAGVKLVEDAIDQLDSEGFDTARQREYLKSLSVVRDQAGRKFADTD